MAAWTLYKCTPKRTIAVFRQVYGAFRTQRPSGWAKNGRAVRSKLRGKARLSLVFQVFGADCTDLNLILVPGGC